MRGEPPTSMPEVPMRADRMSEDDLVPLVERALAAIDSGRTLDLHAICAGDASAMRAVAEALDLDRADDLGRALADAAPRAYPVPRLPPRYRVLGELGAGAMGVVFHAFDEELRRDVAIKCLVGGMFASDVAHRRFLREAEVAARIHSPYVVTIHDRGVTEDDQPFLVMERLRGVSLAAVLAAANAVLEDEGPTGLRGVDWLARSLDVSTSRVADGYLRNLVRWGAQIAEGLDAAHRVGATHRDVKPSNVLISVDEDARTRAVLIDFGIAALQDDGADLTATGTTLGTPWYMAPEAAAGESPGAAADAYGLAATLYHGLVLAPPHHGTPVEVVTRIAQNDPPRLPRRGVPVPVPRDLRAIVERGMERRPNDRYADCAAFAEDLRAFLAYEPVRARVVGPLERTWRRARRRPLAAVGAVALVLTTTLAVVGVPALAAEHRAQVDRAYFEEMRALPALLTLEGYPAERTRVPASERAQQIAALDRILALRPGDAATALVRAAVSFDAGDRTGAAERMARLAARSGDPALDRIAAAYVDAASTDEPLPALDLASLPEPSTRPGYLAAAFCALRTRTADGYRRAEAWLRELGDWPPARDLRLIALLALGKIDDAVEEARRLELLYGGATARTRHVIGMGLASKRLYEQAIPVLEESIALRPGRHGPIHNLGVCLQRTGRTDEARKMLMQAHEIRPWLDNTLRHLAQLEAEHGDLAAARAWAERIPEVTVDGSRWKRPFELAGIAWWRVVECASAWHGRAGESAGAARAELERAAAAADAAFVRVLGSDPPPAIAADAEVSRACIACLRDPDRRDLVAWFVDAALADPDRPAVLSNLAMALPPGPLDAGMTERMRALLVELAARLAPENAGYRAAADTLRRNAR
jgi:tetratricopeptide (TPR) repeat protein